MSHSHKNVLYLNEEEEATLESISRSRTENALTVARAKVLLAVHQGAGYQEAAKLSGRRSGQAAANLVRRFQEKGMDVLYFSHGGGAPKKYGSVERQQVLDCIKQKPNIVEEGANTWSIQLLQKHLERIGVGHLSRDTLWHILHEGGYKYQKSRSWINTGKVMRKREGQLVEVEDPDKEAKKKSNYKSLYTRQ